MTHYLPIKEYVMSTDSSSVSTETKNTEIRVYWQPGCTSCLRTKEFLSSHGIPFVSRNVLADENAFAELSRFGLRQVPIVTLGDKRSEERRVGKECVSTCRSCWSPYL